MTTTISAQDLSLAASLKMDQIVKALHEAGFSATLSYPAGPYSAMIVSNAPHATADAIVAQVA